MTTKIKRSQVKSFLNTGTILSPTWSLIGDGVTSGKINMNPKVTEETYITEDTANISVDSYAPTFPVEATCKAGDAAFEYLDTLRKSRGVLADSETEVVNVWLYKTTQGGFYYAEKQAVSLQVDDFGGDGGQAAKLNYTINFLGDAVKGAFDPVGLDFVAAPVLAVLATMVIGAVTLTPLFATDHYWLYYAGSVASATVSMASTCAAAGAVIVQKDDSGDVVNQGANAGLDMGHNDLTIEVTVGSEVVTYHIDINRTA